MLHTLDLLEAGKLQPEVQDDTLANYAHKLTKAEAQIDWTQSAAVIDRTIRAFDAYPVAFTLYEGQPLRFFASVLRTSPSSPAPARGRAEDGRDFFLSGTVIAESKSGIDIATGDGVVRILSLQLPGGKRLTAEQFLNGRSLARGATVSARATAALCLQRVIYEGESLTEVLQDRTIATLNPQDQALLRDMCFGTLRWHERLSAILKKLVKKALKAADKDVECLLRIGLYQLIYQRKPDHAAVNETVKATKKLKKDWAGKLVNGVLRTFIRQQAELLVQADSTRHGTLRFPRLAA